MSLVVFALQAAFAHPHVFVAKSTEMGTKRARTEKTLSAADVQRVYNIDADLRLQAATQISQHRCERLLMIRTDGPIAAMSFSLTPSNVPDKLFVECTYTAKDLDSAAPFQPNEQIFRKVLLPGLPWHNTWTKFSTQIFRSMVHANEQMIKYQGDAVRATTEHEVLRIALVHNKKEIFSCVCKVVAPFMAPDIRVPKEIEFDGSAYIIGYETNLLAAECAAWAARHPPGSEASWHSMRIAGGLPWERSWKARTLRKIEEMLRANQF